MNHRPCSTVLANVTAVSSGAWLAAAGRHEIVIKTEEYSNESEIHMASE